MVNSCTFSWEMTYIFNDMYVRSDDDDNLAETDS